VYWADEPDGPGAGFALVAGLVTLAAPTWLALAGTAAATAMTPAVIRPLSAPIFLIISDTFRGNKCKTLFPV
jgi:hypothetical protein